MEIGHQDKLNLDIIKSSETKTPISQVKQQIIHCYTIILLFYH